MNREWEIGVLAAVLREASGHISEIMDVAEFRHPPVVALWALCKMGWKKETGHAKRLPTFPELRHAILVLAQNQEPSWIVELLDTLALVEAADYTSYTLLDLERLSLQNRLAKLASEIEVGLVSREPLDDLVEKARLHLQAARGAEKVELIRMSDTKRLQGLEEERRLAASGKLYLPTEWKRFDSLCRYGGIAVDDVLVLHGPTGRGKTTSLVSLACQEASAGRKVLYVSLEGASVQIADRVEDWFVQTPAEKGPDFMDRFTHNFWRNASDRGGEIILAQRSDPSKPWYAHLLSRYLEQFEAELGCRPDLLCLDHLDLVAPSLRHQGKEHLEKADLVHFLKGHAEHWMVPHAAATQGNRSGHNADLVTEQHVAASYDSITHATQWLTICHVENLFGFYVVKNRQDRGGGVGRVMPMSLDMAHQRVTDHPYMELMNIRDWTEMARKERHVGSSSLPAPSAGFNGLVGVPQPIPPGLRTYIAPGTS